MTSIEKAVAPHRVPFKKGDTVVCTYAASSGYSVGSIYEVYGNDKGWKCMRDNSGIEDICCMMFSSFRVATQEDINRSKFKVVS